METCFIPASVEVAARRPSVIPISAGQCQLVVHRRHGVQLINHELLSLAGLVGLAVLATVHPAFHAWCVLDRHALAAGEVWRLWTGHLTHFSASHLVVDALVFTLLAAALRRAGESALGRVLFLGGAALSVSLLVCDSSLARYGGLSGLNALLVGRLALHWVQAGGRQRLFALALLAVAVGKFTLDSIGLGSPSVEFDSVAVVPSHLSHWLGLLWGLVLPVNVQTKNTFSAVRRSIQSRSVAERKSRRSRMRAMLSA